MTATEVNVDPPTRAGTPIDTALNGSLLLAPLLYLTADTMYATRGWDDAAAGIVHVLAAVAYGLVVLAVASRLPPASRLLVAVVVTGLTGMAGNVAYGFETIHSSLGDVPLVDRSGAATVIKPLGLFFPLSLLLVAWALVTLGARWQGLLVLAAGIAWPVAHIGNFGALAVVVNVALVVAFGSLLWDRRIVRQPVRAPAARSASASVL
jgi:hypothetical protein